MKFKIIVIILCFISLNIYAQGGTIKGKVIDAKDSEALIGANVIILDTRLGAATDISGFYEIKKIPPGTHTIKVAFVGYTDFITEGIKITNSDILTLNFELVWDYNSPVEIIQKKPLYKKMPRGCGLWPADMIPIKELYFINMIDSLKRNPPELKPVVVKPPRIEN
jgi:hypothetical protein